MTEASKTEISASGFAPHIEELHEFFRSRSVSFGAPGDLAPFVERVSKDESFRDEMSSLVRTIIYRERDGLMPAELLALMVTAVAGTSGEDAPEQTRDAVRQMMGFLGGVFRSRWNPGGSGTAIGDKADVDVDAAAAKASAAVTADTAASAPVDEPARPMTPIFYQAQVVANGGEEPELSGPVADAKPKAAEKSKAAKAPEAAKAEEVVLPLRGKSEGASEPFLNLAGYAAQPEPVVAFLRGTDTSTLLPAGMEQRRSGGLGWVAAILAVIVAFGAGMYARQLMFARYGAAWPWPWHLRMAGVPAAAPSPSVAPPVVNPGSVQPPAGGAVAGQHSKAVQPRGPAQVEAARSEWKGGDESASDMTEPGSGVPAAGAPSAREGNHGVATDSEAGGGGALQPMMGVSKPGAEADTDLAGSNFADSKDARATAMLGASAALMRSHLLFAPEPQYPEQARIAHIQGEVVVEALVGRDGSVVRAQAISGNRALREAAEKAVYGRRYQPYVVNDIPMAVRTLVTVNFQLP